MYQLNRIMEIVTVRIIIYYVLGSSLAIALGGTIFVLAVGQPLFLVVSLGCPVFLLGIGIPYIWLLSRPYLKDMEEMLAGRAWLHWSYSPEEWKALVKVEKRAFWKENTFSLITLVGIGFGMAALGLVAGKSENGEWLVPMGLILAGFGLFMGVALLITSTGARGRKAASGEVYISKRGVYQVPGGYSPLVGPGISIRGVRLEEANPYRLVFDGISSRLDTLNDNSTIRVNRDYNQAVLIVPAGKEEEARQLAARFSYLTA